MIRAGFFLRSIATLIDAVAIVFFSGLVATALYFGLQEALNMGRAAAEYVAGITFYAMILTYTLCEVVFATSPGKGLLRMVITRADGEPADRWMLLSRWSTKFAPLILNAIAFATLEPTPIMFLGGFMTLIIAIGCLAILGEQRRAWHDRWSGTAVCRIPRNRPQPRGFDVLPAQPHQPTDS